MRTENKNFLMNVAYQGLALAFPLVTVPWVSRALGVDNIGVYSYTYSIASLFMLAGMLGISNYGNRSVARVRDDSEALSREFSAVYTLQLGVNLLSVLAYVAYLTAMPSAYAQIAWIQLLFVASNCLDVSWLFFGLEKFKITITRNLIIKALSLLLIVIFVRQPDDLWLYALTMAGSTLVSQLYLSIARCRYVRFSRPDIRDVASRFKDVSVLFLPVAAYSVYRVLDKTMLGSMSSVTELGYFENAEKLINIPISVITALGTVMLPRMSYIMADPEADCRPAIRRSMNLALMLACGMAMGLAVIADDVCPVLFGSGFEGCAPVIRLLSITVVCSAWSNVVRTQYLIPGSRDSVYVGSTVGAAVVNLALNIALIPRLGSLGACVGTIAAEAFIVLYQSVVTRGELETMAYLRMALIHLAKSSLVAATALLAASFADAAVARLAIEAAVFAVLFCLLNWRYIATEFFGMRARRYRA